ncbi:MAG: hypothetical protein LIO94_12620, partial [Clostridiales bacterium]|nr:hypothetical protein [Clostridiales bacterium]
METTEEITQIPSQTNSEEDAQPMSSDLTPTVPPKASENSESIPPKSSETIPDRLIQEDRADEPVSDASADESVYKVPTDKPVRENSADESVHKTPADESASEQSIDAGSVHNASANKPAPKSDTGESDHEDRPDYLAEAERFQNEENEGSREFLEMKRIRHEKWKKEESRRRRKHILIAV